MNPKANFLLLDAARTEKRMNTAKELNTNYSSLFKGKSQETLGDVAPYLFTAIKDNNFANWYIEHGWGKAWGLLLKAQLPFENIYKHLRKFLLVKTEDGKELYFRFYDPRVLRIFLPTCDTEQLMEFFGPIEYFICEDEDPAYGFVFSLRKDALKTERLTKEEVFGWE